MRDRQPDRETKMHLFVGNLSKSVKVSDLEAEFRKFGNCKVNIPKVAAPHPSSAHAHFLA